MNSRIKGNKKEEEVCGFLKEKGYTIVERNFSSRHGEVDVIATVDGCICFIEVKYRTSEKSGLPEEAVTLAKMKKICKTAGYFLYTHQRYYSFQMRFDVAAVDDKEIRFYENAFEYIGDGNY